MKNQSEYFEQIDNNYNQVIDLSKQKYIVKEIHYSDQYYNASSISKNEKYFAYGGDDLQVQIYDIQLDRLIKEIRFGQPTTLCEFTSDSALLFVGSYKCVYEFNVNKDFKLNHKFYLHQDFVINLITIKNQFIITSSYDEKIIKTATKNKKQLFKLLSHTDYIYALDYNDIDDIIISGSHDKSIKLWSCKNKGILINKDHENMILQIQLINNKQNLLSLDLKGKLQEWQIDLVLKDLIQIKQFVDSNLVFNFYQVNQGQNLLLICDWCIKILDNQGQIINIINHQAGDSSYLDCKQLDSANFIQIRSLNKIQLAIAQT